MPFPSNIANGVKSYITVPDSPHGVALNNVTTCQSIHL